MQHTTKISRASAALSRPAMAAAVEAAPDSGNTEAVSPSGSIQPLAYRVADFCAGIGISASTFWKLVSVQKIRVIRIGGRTLVPADEAARILREGVQ